MSADDAYTNQDRDITNIQAINLLVHES